MEIHTGYPLFPGENEQDQFLRIMEVIGLPPASILNSSKRKKVFFDSQNKPRITPNSRGTMRFPGSKPLHDILGSENLLFLDFIRDILCWEPQLRPSPNAALNHQWLTNILNRQPSPSKKRRNVNSLVEPEFKNSKIYSINL